MHLAQRCHPRGALIGDPWNLIELISELREIFC